MNEQFSKLLQECIVPANQAVDYSKSKGFVIPDEKLDVAKFAELIVRECAKFMDENSGYDNSNNAWHPEPEDLMKHFGVEE